MSKNILIKLVSIILSVVVLVGCFGCVSAQNPTEPDTSAKPTSHYLVKQAKSNYKIVISENAGSLIVTASQELQSLFYQATGVMLPIVYDSGLTHSADNEYLSIGKNALTESASLTASQADIKGQGFYIKTIDKTVYMLGATDRGSLYATYEFLSREFNFEHFFTDVYYIDENVTDKFLNEYDVTEIPDIDQMTVPNVGYIQYNSQNANRMRVVQIAEWSIPQNNYNNVHNIYQIIPYSQFSYKTENNTEYYGEHPAWYSDAVYDATQGKWVTGKNSENSQACFSAHCDLTDVNSDKTEYNAMVDEFLRVIQKGIKKTDAEIFTISQRDNKGFCKCENCLKAINKYGTASSLLVLLCNTLSDKMNEWFGTDEGAPYKRDLKILFLAYQDVEAAPTTYNKETKTYQPSAPEMVCRENVGVYIASLGVYNNYDFNKEKNAEIKENILAWSALTNKFTFWIYDVNFNNYFYPYDSFVIKKEYYKLMNQVGTTVLNDQGQTQNIGSCTAWDNLKSYLETKLRWDTDADLEALTKRYFKVCYKTAADTMYSLYLQSKAHASDMRIKFENGYFGSQVGQSAIADIFGGIKNPVLWQKSTVTSWYNQFLLALSQLDQIKESDPKGYESAYKMVCAELASPLYILIDLYSDTYAESTLNKMKQDFKKYCTIAGINSYFDSTATGGIENLYKHWGIE